MVIFVGDMYQLKPVKDTPLYGSANSIKTPTPYAIAGQLLWHRVNNCIILDEQMRQADDKNYHGILIRMRRGEIMSDDIIELQERFDASQGFTSLSTNTKYIVRMNMVRDFLNMRLGQQLAKES